MTSLNPPDSLFLIPIFPASPPLAVLMAELSCQVRDVVSAMSAEERESASMKVVQRLLQEKHSVSENTVQERKKEIKDLFLKELELAELSCQVRDVVSAMSAEERESASIKLLQKLLQEKHSVSENTVQERKREIKDLFLKELELAREEDEKEEEEAEEEESNERETKTKTPVRKSSFCMCMCFFLLLLLEIAEISTKDKDPGQKKLLLYVYVFLSPSRNSRNLYEGPFPVSLCGCVDVCLFVGYLSPFPISFLTLSSCFLTPLGHNQAEQESCPKA